MPTEMFETIFYKMSFGDQSHAACVCKAWHALLTNDQFGEPYLREINLQTSKKVSWMRRYRDYIDTPQILVLDVSSSMIWRIPDVINEKMKPLIAKLEAPLRYRGIDCVVFAAETHMKILYNPDEVIDFFIQKGHGHSVGHGTNFKKLFAHLVDLQEYYREERPSLTCQVTILSDFEDEMKFSHLLPKQFQMHIQCINVGDGQDDRCLRNFTDDSERWAYSLAVDRHQRELDQCIVYEKEDFQFMRGRRVTAEHPANSALISSSRSAKRQRRHITGQRQERQASAVKRKREISLVPEYEIPFTIATKSFEDWEPMQKKAQN